jgi:hypothetical protein
MEGEEREKKSKSRSKANVKGDAWGLRPDGIGTGAEGKRWVR